MPKIKQSAKNTLSDTEQAELLKLPLHTSKEIQSYLKPGEGFERVAPIALAVLTAHPEIAKALKLDPVALEAELARGIHLADVSDGTRIVATVDTARSSSTRSARNSTGRAPLIERCLDDVDGRIGRYLEMKEGREEVAGEKGILAQQVDEAIVFERRHRGDAIGREDGAPRTT